jgi:glycosyltransferase involved in cell wall biosynthesis
MGMVEQLQIPSLIAPALFSIILYDISTPNNRFCEPNRMYQAIAMGVPVIVGCNEPMKDIVERYKFGISLKSDGRDVTEIETAIIKILKQREHFKVNILENYRNILWEQQETLLLNPINVHKV